VLTSVRYVISKFYDIYITDDKRVWWQDGSVGCSYWQEASWKFRFVLIYRNSLRTRNYYRPASHKRGETIIDLPVHSFVIRYVYVIELWNDIPNWCKHIIMLCYDRRSKDYLFYQFVLLTLWQKWFSINAYFGKRWCF
jgi:hypothetical protein